MSISYYGVATADRERIGPLVEGNAHPGIPLLDTAALYRALTTQTPLRGPEDHTLRWEDGEGGYVFVDLSPTCVLVTQGTRGGEDGIFVIIDIVAALNRAGVNVYDPQQGRWFAGSPVKPTARSNARGEPRKKAKPRAKAGGKPKATRPTARPRRSAGKTRKK